MAYDRQTTGGLVPKEKWMINAGGQSGPKDFPQLPQQGLCSALIAPHGHLPRPQGLFSQTEGAHSGVPEQWGGAGQTKIKVIIFSELNWHVHLFAAF